jgi:uncharacterized protein with von Willebrand factor type A (vWA) domain
MGYGDIIKRLFGRKRKHDEVELSRSVVTHDSVDRMVFKNFRDDSPRFRNTLESAPKIPPNVEQPKNLDFTTASPDEIAEWQAKARAAKAALDAAPPYDAWEDLMRDVFYAYHHARDPQVVTDNIDPAVAFHAKIVQKLQATEEFTLSRNLTRDDGPTAAGATLASTRVLKEGLSDELLRQAQQSEEFTKSVEDARDADNELDALRAEARAEHAQNGEVSASTAQVIRETVKQRQQARAKAEQIANGTPVPFDKAAHDVVIRAAQAAKNAAETMGNVPSFGQGFGDGEPRYESPEQALSIAEMWTNNPVLIAVAELYGKMDKHIRFERAKRISGGQDEIVDVTLGDDLRRVVNSELALLSDPDTEDLFYAEYIAAELPVYTLVGEEHAGRGPIVLVVDESGSMSGERNIWAKAIALCLLNISRREKRDFAYVGFSSPRQVHAFEFKTKRPLDPQAIVDMASHFYGGGTDYLTGVEQAVRIMDQAGEFRKADIVLVGDGDASFSTNDKIARDHLTEKGVRLHGIGIGGSFGYLQKMCAAGVVAITDFELQDPSEATAHLATHVS